MVKRLAGALVANSAALFTVFCGRCWREARTRRRGGSMDPAMRRAAAARLYRMGWRYGATALCPPCAKENPGPAPARP